LDEGQDITPGAESENPLLAEVHSRSLLFIVRSSELQIFKTIFVILNVKFLKKKKKKYFFMLKK
jgi:hypothetical protein